jgi:5-oxoprolinase (ATP-hydrolysing) subunit A
MRIIDLNVDLGEGGPHDAELIAWAGSANIACGGHAGDEDTMRAAVSACLSAGVAIGAHPGYEDREHFGRRLMNLTAAGVGEMVCRQIRRLAGIAASMGAEIDHVKPHGALYHQADADPQIAAAVADAVRGELPGCRFYVPPGGALERAGKNAGLAVIVEGFVDRRYRHDGRLVPRGEAAAVIHDPETAVAQALEIALHKQVKTVGNEHISLPAQTLCVHGDGTDAVVLLKAVRQALEAGGFTIRA